ncbi:MAG: hypothetical protein GQ572_04790 [Gammaproteobacteria bacterium]|nr:hypothetical protein [Gammaproteobacteria bacterium]
MLAALTATGIVQAATPTTKDGVTTIHLDEYNGYFAAQETLVSLKPGTYDFVVNNKAGKLVGFWLQDNVTKEFLFKSPLEEGKSLTARVTLTENGFRYRCPINPTAWYEVGVSQ